MRIRKGLMIGIPLISGLGPGSVYALIVLDYSMVYGIAEMLNFAHGSSAGSWRYPAESMVSRLTRNCRRVR